MISLQSMNGLNNQAVINYWSEHNNKVPIVQCYFFIRIAWRLFTRFSPALHQCGVSTVKNPVLIANLCQLQLIATNS